MDRTWMARLTGDVADLRSLTIVLNGPDYIVRELRPGEYYLGAAAFDPNASATRIRDQAVALIPRINGAARVLNANSRSVTFGGDVIHLAEDGRQDIYIFPPPLSARAMMLPVDLSTGDDSSAQQPTDSEVLLLKVEQRPTAANVLHQFGQEPTWGNLYKVLDAIEESLGGEKALLATGWVSDRKLTRFTRTANTMQAIGDNSRHGKRNQPAPPKPMTLQDAQALIRLLVKKYLETI